MDWIQAVALLGGAALFLFGMSCMGDGLKRLSGEKLELILYRLTGTPLRGALLGAGVTAVIQSSCATSVMAVGFVNAGMMKTRQGISVVLGSILGTSITGWIVCLSYIEGGSGLAGALDTAVITSVVAVAAIVLRMVSRRDALRNVSDILIGFALLMFGLSVMSGSMEELGQKPWFTSALTAVRSPILTIFIGAAFTAILQSASAAVGIVQALSVTGLISLGQSLPLLMGIAVGASVPVLLSAIGASTEARRTAVSYPVVSVLGAIVCAALFYAADAVWGFAFLDAAADPFSLAAANTILRLGMTALLLPFPRVLEGLTARLCPEKAEEETSGMETRFLEHPALALAQSRITVADMADEVRAALRDAFGLLRKYSEAGFKEVARREEAVDRFEDTLGTYLVKVSAVPMSAKQNEDLYLLLHSITDLERIADHAMNIAENAREIHEKNIDLGPEAAGELEVMERALAEVVELAIRALLEEDRTAARRVEPLEELIDDLCDEMKHRHVDRLQHGVYGLRSGFVYNDLIANTERVSDHCSNIAVALLELEHDSFDTHDYIESLRRRKDAEFERSFAEYREKYAFS